MNRDVWIQDGDDPNSRAAPVMWRSLRHERSGVGPADPWPSRSASSVKLEIPLSGGEDRDGEPDPSATDEDGNPAHRSQSHVGLFSSYAYSSGHTMFRWGWNFSNGFQRRWSAQGRHAHRRHGEGPRGGDFCTRSCDSGVTATSPVHVITSSGCLAHASGPQKDQTYDWPADLRRPSRGGRGQV